MQLANDSSNPDVFGASERDLRRVSRAIHWVAIGIVAVALGCFYALPARARELVGRVVRIADGDTLTILDAGRHQIPVRLAEIDAPEKAQPFGTRSKQSLAKLCVEKVAMIANHGLDRYGRMLCAGIDANAEQARQASGLV